MVASCPCAHCSFSAHASSNICAPSNPSILIFLAIAFVLFVLDIKAPTHGALTAAGAASLIVGSLVLFNSPGTPSFLRVSVPLVIGVSIATAGVFFFILIVALRAQRAPVRTGQESFVGRIGTARTKLAPFGTVQMGGELWSGELAPGEDTITEGTSVEVLEIKGDEELGVPWMRDDGS